MTPLVNYRVFLLKGLERYETLYTNHLKALMSMEQVDLSTPSAQILKHYKYMINYYREKLREADLTEPVSENKGGPYGNC